MGIVFIALLVGYIVFTWFAERDGGTPSAEMHEGEADGAAPVRGGVGVAAGQPGVPLRTAVELARSVRATDPDGRIDRVRYTVTGQFEGVIAAGTMTDGGDGVYTAAPAFRLGRDQRGRYSVLVYAVDDGGLLSNEARGLFILAGIGLGPPVVEAIDGPAEFRPPGVLRFVVTVADPDGLGDIARVELTAPAGGVFQLFDDGQTFGDEVAGDGRFTAAFDVPEAAPGPQTFVFRAFDRDGLVSEDVPFTVTILE